MLIEGKNSLKTKVWKDISNRYRGDYIEGRFSSSEKVSFIKDGLPFTLDTHVKSLGMENSGEEYTRLIASYNSIDNFFCEVYQEGFFQQLSKLIGMQDIKVGFKNFDDKFILKSNKPVILKRIFGKKELLEQMCNHPKMRIMIKTENRFLGGLHPLGQNEITFEEKGHIIDIDKLESILSIISSIHKQMLSLNIAKPI
jgi:hypothetical protein